MGIDFLNFRVTGDIALIKSENKKDEIDEVDSHVNIKTRGILGGNPTRGYFGEFCCYLSALWCRMRRKRDTSLLIRHAEGAAKFFWIVFSKFSTNLLRKFI